MRKRQSFHHTGLMTADRSIAIFADRTAASALGDRRVVQFVEQAA
jgi:hypothetical protein